MDFSKYIFRSHMVGKIISVQKPLTKSQLDTFNSYEDRKNGIGKPLTNKQLATWGDLYNRKNEKAKLTDGQKNILSVLALDEKYGTKNELNSPKIRKGLEKEKEARDLISSTCGLFLTANEERRTNDFVTGEIDIKPNDVIVDIKTAWCKDSYAKILNYKPNEVYLRQLDSYMDLWNKNQSLLCHVLIDTPFHLITKELWSFDYRENILDIDGNVRDEHIDKAKQLILNHIFTEKGLNEFCEISENIERSWFDDFKERPAEERIHMIPHYFEKSRIEQRNECIHLSREFMSSVKSVNNFNPNLIK